MLIRGRSTTHKQYLMSCRGNSNHRREAMGRPVTQDRYASLDFPVGNGRRIFCQGLRIECLPHISYVLIDILPSVIVG